MNHRPLSQRLPLLLLAVPLLIGCGPTGEHGEKPLAVSPADARSAIAGIYVGTGRLEFAEQTKIAGCMAKAGFHYSVLPQGEDQGLTTDYSDDVTRAKTAGFGLAADHARTQQSLLLDSTETSGGQAQAYHRALMGGPDAKLVRVRASTGDVIEASTTGCFAEARRALYGSVEKALQFSEFRSNIVKSVMYRARHTSPTMEKAFQKWRTCMASHGFPNLLDRNSARALAMKAYEEKSARDAHIFELNIAAIDAQCDRESGYARVARPVEDQALARFITDHEAEISALQEIQRQAVANAR